MKIIIRSNQENIIMDLPYDQILDLLNILRLDTSKYCKNVTMICDKLDEENLKFITRLKNIHNVHVECQINIP